MTESKAGQGPLLHGAADATGYRAPLPDLGGDGFSMKDAGASASVGARGALGSPSAVDGGMDRTEPLLPRRWFADAPLAIKTIALFWTVYFASTSLRAVLMDQLGQSEQFRRRAAVVAVAMLLSFFVYLALQLVARRGIAAKIAVAALACLPPAVIQPVVNNYMFYVYAPEAAPWIDPMSAAEMAKWTTLKLIADVAYSWYFFFGAWAAIYVALSYARQLREADRRAAALTRQAQEAQLRALRYQINPHFLFNTLNSLSALVLAKRTEAAEQMLANLSAFFRTTLTTEPTADVALAEEIRLQRLYLEIEQVRFPERLKIEIDVPEELLARRVPVLILQPVVENCVKYGVAKARRPVTIRISAYEEAGRIHLKVKDDGDGVAEGAAESTGVGLRNVCDRLASRFGESGGCIHGADPGGGYTVHIYFPAIRGD